MNCSNNLSHRRRISKQLIDHRRRISKQLIDHRRRISQQLNHHRRRKFKQLILCNAILDCRSRFQLPEFLIWRVNDLCLILVPSAQVLAPFSSIARNSLFPASGRVLALFAFIAHGVPFRVSAELRGPAQEDTRRILVGALASISIRTARFDSVRDNHFFTV
jgi:hypothetical protein